MNNMNIRTARAEDVLEIQSLMDMFNDERQNNFSEENRLFHARTQAYPKLISEDIDKDVFFVAEDEYKIIGFVRGSIHERTAHTLSKLGSIDELFILKEHRGKSAATELLKRIMHHYSDLGCDHINAHTDHENIAAQKLYESVGMKKATIEYWTPL